MSINASHFKFFSLAPSLLPLTYVQDCTQLQNFYDSVHFCHQKSRPLRVFALHDFPLLLCFSHLGDGASEFIKLCENCDKLGPQRFVSPYDFSLPLCLSHLPDGAAEFNKFCENCEKSFRLPTYPFSLTSSSLSRRADVKLIALVSH